MRPPAGATTLVLLAAAEYAMSWKPDNGGRRAGRVGCRNGFLHLDATAPAPAAATQRIALHDIRVVSLVGGTLLLDIDGAPSIRLSSLDGVGTLLELAQQIAAARSRRPTSVRR